ncbi:alpha-L-arabinofuranosidase C-terminal domain-containing protein, partial [uncultured Parabacteroides sp.]
GGVRDTLCTPVPYPFQSNRWYNVKIACKGEQIGYFVNDTLVHEAILPGIPSLISTATLNKETHTIILKVINTTQHEEKTELDLQGVSIKNTAEIIQLAGDPEARNTYSKPDAIVPETKEISFSLSGPRVYNFPPNSITIMKLKID